MPTADALWVLRRESIGRGTDYIVMEYPDHRWLQHHTRHVLVRVHGNRLIFHTPSDCWDIVHILWVVEII